MEKLNTRKPWELTKEEREKSRVPEGYKAELIENELINLAKWKSDIADFEYNINTLTSETFIAVLKRNIRPYFEEGYWQTYAPKCQACSLWNGICHLCPVFYWSTEVHKFNYTLCKNLRPDHKYSDWDKVGLHCAFDPLLEFYAVEENVEAFKRWALKQLKKKHLSMDFPNKGENT